MAKSTHAIIMIVVVLMALGIHGIMMLLGASTAVLGVLAVNEAVGVLVTYVGYQTGKLVGHQRGVKDGLDQAADTQRQVEEMAKIHDEQGIQRSGQVSG